MITEDHEHKTISNHPHEPLLFYLRDQELYYTSFAGPRYNEHAIYIDYQEWYLSKEIPFYQYLKIIKAYRTLLQDLNNHPVLVVMPTGYIETFRYYQQQCTYWTTYELHIFEFVTKMIPDIHICPFDQYYSHVLIPLQTQFQPNISCLIQVNNELHCKLRLEYSKFTEQQEKEEAKRLLLKYGRPWMSQM